MNLHFFPKDKTFWKYHITGISIFAIYQAFIIISVYPQKTFNTLASIMWVILVSLGVLLIRFNYKKREWHKLGIAYQILRTVGLSVLLAPSIMLIIFSSLLPFFADSMFTEANLAKHNTTQEKYTLWLYLSNTVSVALVINLWTFIYIGITTTRRAHEAAINNLKLENSLKEARLAGLTNQLNPHFLFNSLNNIRFKIHENAMHADKMITTLSDILRYSLEGGRREKVRLEEEISNTNKYIEIMQLQLEDRLDYQLEIEPDDLAYLVPPMLLQLLVENAIKHGIDNIRDRSTLTLTCASTESDIIITVTNPMPDLKENTEGVCTENLSNQSSIQNNMGIGLRNIQERLDLLYNQSASLETLSKDGKFSVTVVIPKEA